METTFDLPTDVDEIRTLDHDMNGCDNLRLGKRPNVQV